jgi:hypothetical protein
MKGQFTVIDSWAKKKRLFRVNITLFIWMLVSDITKTIYCDQSCHIQATQYHMKWKYLPDGDSAENSNTCCKKYEYDIQQIRELHALRTAY